MQIQSKSSLSEVLLPLCAGVLGAFSLLSTAHAQDSTPPAAPAAQTTQTQTVWGRVPFEAYAGFSYFRPFHSDLDTPYADGTYIQTAYGSAHTGTVASLSYFFSQYAGVQIEAGLNPDGYNDGFWTAQGGLVLHKPSHGFQPFGHILGGATEIAGPNGIADRPYYHVWTWEPSLLVGGGVDRELPFFEHRFSVRLVQADYTFFRPNFGTQTNGTGGSTSINALQLSAGLVLHPGWYIRPAVALTCSASPASVYPGDPVSVSGSATGLDPKRTAAYTWAGAGLPIKGAGAMASINTAMLAPGNYPITGHVSGGTKPGMSADCSTQLAVKQFDPPTVSCSAAPATVASGGTSTITAKGVSPQNRPLTYSYSASAGQIGGTGPTATLSGIAGPVTVTCTVTDDKGQTGSGTTDVAAEAPPVPPVKHTQTLCSITFGRDTKRPERVDNEAKACLDSVTLSAKSQPDANLVIVGESSADEKKPSAHRVANLAAQRAANTREFLTTEEGIDGSRIAIRTGNQDEKSVENYLVPAGASFDSDVTGTTAVGDSAVKAESWKPLPTRKAAPKPATSHKKVAHTAAARKSAFHNSRRHRSPLRKSSLHKSRLHKSARRRSSQAG